MTGGSWQTGPELKPRRPRTPVADLFEQTFGLYRRNFVSMVLVTALFQGPLILASLPLTVWQAQWSRQLSTPASTAAVLDQMGPYVASSVLTSLLALVLGSFGGAGVTYIAGRARSGDRASIGEVLRAVRRLTPSIAGYIVLFIGGSLALGLAFVAVAFIAALIGGLAGNVGLAIVVIVLLGLAVMITVVITLARLALSLPALVLERHRPMNALRRSWSLVAGWTWRTIGILLLVGLVFGIIGLVVSPVNIPGVMAGYLEGSLGSYVVLAIVGGAIQIAVGPILPTLVTVLFFDYAAERP